MLTWEGKEHHLHLLFPGFQPWEQILLSYSPGACHFSIMISLTSCVHRVKSPWVRRVVSLSGEEEKKLRETPQNWFDMSKPGAKGTWPGLVVEAGQGQFPRERLQAVAWLCASEEVWCFPERCPVISPLKPPLPWPFFTHAIFKAYFSEVFDSVYRLHSWNWMVICFPILEMPRRVLCGSFHLNMNLSPGSRVLYLHLCLALCLWASIASGWH